MTDVVIHKDNELYIRIACDRGIALEMYDHFSYFVPDYKFMPRYKSGIWDGKIRLFDIKRNRLYLGLVSDVKDFCDKYGYSCEVDAQLGRRSDLSDVKDFVRSIPTLCRFEPRDYQIAAFVAATVEQKTLILSPTGSGKSLIIYLVAQYMRTISEKKILLVVPTTSLVEQMASDFNDYDPEHLVGELCHKIYTGKSKETEPMVKITLDDGSVFTVPGSQFIKTINRGKVQAKDLTCEDDISI